MLGALFACGDEQSSEPKAPAEPTPVAAAPAAAAEPSPEPAPVAPAPVLEDFDDGGDEASALRRLGALPAWSAAIERYRFLARRGQSGALHGLLVESSEGFRLVDETVGGGALSIPVALPEGLTLQPPLRVLLWGAWQPGESPRWQWHAARVAKLRPPAQEPVMVPAFAAVEKPAPKDAVIASEVARRGGTISFVVKKKSSRVGDGWLIADGPKGAPVARLLLPGEKETYGDQSELTDEERWTLKRNVRYWLTIRGVRGTRPGKLPVYRARSAPFRDDDAPAPKAVEPPTPAE